MWVCQFYYNFYWCECANSIIISNDVSVPILLKFLLMWVCLFCFYNLIIYYLFYFLIIVVSECYFCCRGGSCQTQAKTSPPHSQGRARTFEKENRYFLSDNFNSAPMAFVISTMEKSEYFTPHFLDWNF
jgi:hypothetical protein